MRKPTIGLGLGVSALLLAGTSGTALAQAADANATDKNAQAQAEIVVTGVFSAKRIEAAPISINVVTSKELSEQSAVSSADLLKNIPGVFVNSALGEIRNIVFSRGISANSLDGATGYYYVSLQEDGLPVDLVTSSNYGPDYYLRSDITLSRLEGLRGGTAAITGPNAPGGIFNYISKTGKSDPGVEMDVKFGLQGNGKLPLYRTDLYAGGQLAPDLYYSIGGFLRTDDGTHDAGYALDKGGQVKANLLYEYGNGSLELTAKYLNDANDWNEFTPALGGTKIAPGFSNVSSDLQPASAAHCGASVYGGSTCWNPTNLVHNRSYAFGLTWKQDLGSGFHIDNKLRYSHNQSDWNTGAVLSVVSINDPIVNILLGTAFLSPGTLNYYNAQTGALAASMNVTGNGPGSLTTATNNLPNQGIVANSGFGGAPGVYVGAADTQNVYTNEFEDQFTLTGELGNHHLALGGFIGLTKLNLDNSGEPGIGLMTLQPQPQMLRVTYTPTGSSSVYQVTDPTGFGTYGAPEQDSYWGTQRQYSVFFGDSWKISDKLSLEAGGRWEAVDYDINNQSWNSSPFNAVPQFNAAGGVDGNPLTLYDNAVSSVGPVYETRRDFSYFNYSLAADYDVSSNLSTYIRFSSGRKAPDFGGIESINTPGQIATGFPSPQKIEQVELGIKYFASGVSLQFFPFYSLLQNVNVPTIFTYTSGAQIGQNYTEPAFDGQIRTYGIEVAAAVRITPTFNVHGNLTLQNPRASKFYTWTQGPSGNGSDDTKSLIPSGDADNNPKIILRSGFDWSVAPKVKLFGDLDYLGKRAANADNAFYLPGFATVNLGAAWNVTDKIKVQFNANNVFNSVGIMSWSLTGFLASLNRQGLTQAQYNPQAIYPVVPSQARAFFWTASVKF